MLHTYSILGSRNTTSHGHEMAKCGQLVQKKGSSEAPEKVPRAIVRALIQKSAYRDMAGVGELASMPRILASALRLSHE